MIWVIGLVDDYDWAWRHKGKRQPRSWKHAKFCWPHSMINEKISNRLNYLFEQVSNYPHWSQPSYLVPRCPYMIEKGAQYCAQFTKWYWYCWGYTNTYAHHSHPLQDPSEAHEAIKNLEKNHSHLKNVESLYASLSISNAFPELDGLSLDIIWVLLMTCDLKIYIHKWAITNFLEFDKLDRAIGEKQNPLGEL